MTDDVETEGGAGGAGGAGRAADRRRPKTGFKRSWTQQRSHCAGRRLLALSCLCRVTYRAMKEENM